MLYSSVLQCVAVCYRVLQGVAYMYICERDLTYMYICGICHAIQCDIDDHHRHIHVYTRDLGHVI